PQRSSLPLHPVEARLAPRPVLAALRAPRPVGAERHDDLVLAARALHDRQVPTLGGEVVEHPHWSTPAMRFLAWPFVLGKYRSHSRRRARSLITGRATHRQLIVSSGGPAGSPGYSSDAPPTWKAALMPTVCPSASACESRTAESRAESHSSCSTSPLWRQDSTLAKLNAETVSVRAMVRTRPCS